MERIIIKRLEITSGNQQLLFQIRLPRDSKRIVGVCVTATVAKIPRNQEMGWLWLSTPYQGKAFYTQIVNPVSGEYSISILPMIEPPNLDDGSLWISGSKIEFNNVNCPVSETIVEGFYSDQRTVNGSYSVAIYLKVEL